MNNAIFTSNYAPGVQHSIVEILDKGFIHSSDLNRAYALMDRIPVATTESDMEDRTLMIMEAYQYILDRAIEHSSQQECKARDMESDLEKEKRQNIDSKRPRAGFLF